MHMFEKVQRGGPTPIEAFYIGFFNFIAIRTSQPLQQGLEPIPYFRAKSIFSAEYLAELIAVSYKFSIRIGQQARQNP